ncbi:hypothetical protein J1N51_02460 [Psychrosphaera ytuae]|uniref:Porin domain-containing protein n=1 Tax=Psychrosphaera ytuae TaxID=2820710 RepID=A0A975DCD6_9GAMM|nr:hypothetical protein [Psychrosphaera ytuae]QTH64369.1 hypothetical protein J1N51_02460 [Psychrosphaera ytuae]
MKHEITWKSARLFMTFKHILNASVGLALIISTGACSIEPEFDISGFGQVVGGYLNTDKATYQGYDDSFSIDQQSILGLQADVQFNKYISASGQAVAYASDTKTSGLEWLFVNITPSQRWQVRLGRHKTPFFNYSDSVDVGFTYPWVSLPQQVYNFYLFSSFEGAFVRYDIPNKQYALNFEAYWGAFDDDYYIAETKVDVEVDDLAGLITNLQVNNFTFRLAYHQGNVNTKLPNLQAFIDTLYNVGFTKSADSLTVDGHLDFIQASVNYENPSYFSRAEWTKIVPDILVVPEIQAYYLSAGIYDYPFTYHITFANSDMKFSDPVQEIPVGVSPELDMLAFGYQTVFRALDKDELSSFSIGTRWDWKPNIAFKADLTFLRGEADQRSFYQITDPSFDRHSTLFQLAVSWVF